jgi:transcriptional regulator with XRE-family HTH domain
MNHEIKMANKLLAMVNAIGLERAEIADYLGVSERTLYRWMSGEAAFPRMVFIALAVFEQFEETEEIE